VGEDKPEEERRAKPESASVRGVEEFNIMDLFKGGGLEELDPLTRFFVVQEMLDEWRERREEKRGRRESLSKEDIARIVEEAVDRRLKKGSDVEELVKKWDDRFRKYQSRIERLMLGRKVREAEEKARKAEEEARKMREREEQEKILRERVQEALAPYKEEIAKLRESLTEVTKNMSEGERKGFFQKLGEEIEKSIGGEVTETIAKKVAGAVVDAFTPKEEETPVTREGKIDTVRMVDRWVKRGLDVVDRYIKSRGPPPPMKTVEKMSVEEQKPQQVEVKHGEGGGGAGEGGKEQKP
jgi:hypothetical protein